MKDDCENRIGITEETANELCKAFEGVSNSLKNTANEMDKNLLLIGKNLLAAELNNTATKLVYTARKLVGSSWLTRWYWKRQYRKLFNKLSQLKSVQEDFFPNKNNIS